MKESKKKQEGKRDLPFTPFLSSPFFSQTLSHSIPPPFISITPTTHVFLEPLNTMTLTNKKTCGNTTVFERERMPPNPKSIPVLSSFSLSFVFCLSSTLSSIVHIVLGVVLIKQEHSLLSQHRIVTKEHK